MRQLLQDLWSHDRRSIEHEWQQKYKFIFLTRTFLIFIAVATGITIYRWHANPWIDVINISAIAIAGALLYFLRRYRHKLDLISSLTVVGAFLACAGLYVVALDNTLRMVLFFPLVAFIFYLQGRRSGLFWLGMILLLIFASPYIPAINPGYAQKEIIIASVYLALLFFILWNFEMLSEEHQKRSRDFELRLLVKERWKLALESTGDAIWDWAIPSNQISYSQSYVGMLDYSEKEIGNDFSTVFSLMHPEDRGSTGMQLSAFLQDESDGQFSAEFRLRSKNDRYKWILCRGRIAERDTDNRPIRMLGTHVDITDRKQIESALKENGTRLKIALDAANMGAWDLDLSTNNLYWSPEIFRILGLEPFQPTMADFMRICHAEDVEAVGVALNKALDDKTSFIAEFRFEKQGALRWAEDRGEIICDTEGIPQRVIGTFQDITERKEHEKQLKYTAHYDALTGVPNRVLLADRLSQALARTKREQEVMAVCYLDLDGFKPVNDTYGHEAGDKILIEITSRIKRSIREDDTVARLGGDEFVVLLVGMQAADECISSLDRLLQLINQPIEIRGNQVVISASIGVTLYPDDDRDADALLRHADQAMYIAKQAGKNRYHMFDAANDLRARSHQELMEQIRHGLAHNEFELYYQPKVEMRSRRMIGAEALIRWHHPKRGFLPPGEFLHAIENTDLEIDLGNWVIDKAFAQLDQWQQIGMDISLSINISANHLQSADFVSGLHQRIRQCNTRFEANRLEIEVLETAALDDVTKVGAIIKTCQDLGVGFALDDFGTGYSSLSYLSNLKVDTLKIDQSFVRDMLEEKGDYAIVMGIIALANAFDRSIVAEGVESEAQFQELLQMGCGIGQGFGIARPMPAADLHAWNTSWSAGLAMH